MNEQRLNWSNSNKGNNNEQIKKIKKMKQITKKFNSLSQAFDYVRILKKYYNIVKMKSKGNVYTYSFE